MRESKLALGTNEIRSNNSISDEKFLGTLLLLLYRVAKDFIHQDLKLRFIFEEQ